jgi:hypothetical protein
VTPRSSLSRSPQKPTPQPTSRCRPGAVFTRPNKSVTVATRISPEDLAEIERLAARLDVPPASLIRGWILSGLNAQKEETVQSTIERISASVQRLRELVA